MQLIEYLIAPKVLHTRWIISEKYPSEVFTVRYFSYVFIIKPHSTVVLQPLHKSCFRLSQFSKGRILCSFVEVLFRLFCRDVAKIATLIGKYLLLLLLCGLELPLDLDLERRDVCGLTGLSFSCFTFTFNSRSGDSLRLCRFSLAILHNIHRFVC